MTPKNKKKERTIHSFFIKMKNMYFVKFNNIAVFAQQSGKLVRKTSINTKLINLEDEDSFKKLSKKFPYANCKRLDYFGEKSKTVIPGHVMDIITRLPEIVAILKEVERDNKINSILGDE